MNRARSSGIDEAVAESVVNTELCEPAASPDPMCKNRIRPAGQNCSGRATRSQPPAIGAAPQRYQCSQTYAKNLQQRGQGRGRAIERQSAEKKWLHCNPIPILAGENQGVTGNPDESLPGKSANEIHDRRDRQSANHRHHHVTSVARTSQPCVNEGNSGGRKRHEKNEEQAGNHRCVRESGNRHGHYLLSSRRIK